VVLASCGFAGVRAVAGDCNLNGIDDTCESPDSVDMVRPVTFPTGANGLTLLAPADLDGDADSDLVLRIGSTQPLKILRQADRRFILFGPVAASRQATAVAFLDADEDGDIDACARNRTAGAAVFFINCGDGGYCHTGRLSGLPRLRIVEAAHLDAQATAFPCLLVVTDEERSVLRHIPLRLGSDADGECITLLGYLLDGGTAARCLDAVDADDNERLQVTDVIVLLLRDLFAGGSGPPAPRPEADECGLDPTGDLLHCVERTCP
jgi:hypothetical protein